jgi:hypothetical protein
LPSDKQARLKCFQLNSPFLSFSLWCLPFFWSFNQTQPTSIKLQHLQCLPPPVEHRRTNQFNYFRQTLPWLLWYTHKRVLVNIELFWFPAFKAFSYCPARMRSVFMADLEVHA